MTIDLTDADRAAIAAAWVGCAFGNGGARAIQAAAEATYAAGLAAGRARALEDAEHKIDGVERKYRYSSNAGMAACQECAAAIRALTKG